jgi:hypothetical protein
MILKNCLLNLGKDKGIGYGCERDSYGEARDAQGIGYGCKRDRLWMRKG